MKHIPERVIPAQELKQCAVCNRFFSQDRLHAHETICQVSSNITRKSFNISEQIIRGTDAETLLKENEHPDCRKSKRGGMNTNWRGKHEEFLRKIREAKQQVSEKSVTNGEMTNQPLLDDDMDCIQCQYCLRQYNKVSAARHISICAWRSAKGNH